jgi:hypothetical protein
MRASLKAPDLARVIQKYIDDAVTVSSNLLPNGEINWDYIDADVITRLNPIKQTVELYYEIFDELVEDYQK